MDEKEVELAIEDHNSEVEKKAREKQTIDVSSSNDEESSEGDEVSSKQFSKVLIEEQVSPVRNPDDGIPVKEDPRQLASKDFISNDNFIKSPEFMSFLYKVKGKAIRQNVGEVNTSNKKQLLATLENEIEQEMARMTPD